MAADVREAEYVVAEESFQGSEDIPSHFVDKKQLMELIHTQNELVERLTMNASQQDSIIKESVMSHEAHRSKLEKLQMSMLEDYVPRDDYDKVVENYELEKLEHGKTKGQLMTVTDKLDFALCQIEVLTKQLEREKTAFENAFGSLKTKAVKESSKNQVLENRCTDIQRKYGEQATLVVGQQEEIQALERKLRNVEKSSKFRVTELEVERQQEKYIMSLMEGKAEKKCKARNKLKF